MDKRGIKVETTIEKLDGLKSDKPVIQKSTPLLSLWRSPLTLSEFKILDAYLARIDSHHPEKRWVCFSKADLEELLGVKKINIADLSKRIDHLAVMVRIDNPGFPDGFDKVALFERAVCEKTKDGWQVNLCCTPSAMKYIFNIENLGYLRYKLRSIIHLSSRYSYLMFLYLERNRFRGEWDVELADLRSFLGCAEDSYTEYRYFNQFVLRKSKLELEEKTDCRFVYEPIRQGKRVVRLHFQVEPLPFLERTKEDGDIAVLSGASVELPSRADPNPAIGILQSACLLPNGEPEFSETEMQHIDSLLVHVPQSKLPYKSAKPNSVFSKRQYLAERYAAMNRQAEKKPIKHRYNYLLKMIRRDIGLD